MITAKIESRPGEHGVTLATGANSHAIRIAPKASGSGSSANGGELLCLALATCYCNDIYREAARRSIEVVGVEVTAAADFPAEGAAARRLSYRAKIRARASEEEIISLIVHTDTVAEIHNTLRLGIAVELESFEAIPA